MTLLFESNFTQANTASGLEATGGNGILDGRPWAATVGTWGISSNTAYTSANGIGAYLRVTPNSIGNNVYRYDARVTLSTLPSTNDAGIQFRGTGSIGSMSGFAWTVDSGGAIRLYSVFVGTRTLELGPYSTFLAGDMLRIVHDGNSIDLYHNSSLLATYSSGSLATTGSTGPYCNNNTTARFDNFSVRTLDSAPLMSASNRLRPAIFKPGTAR